MEKNKSIVLPSKLYADAPDQDLSLRLDLEKSEGLLREGDRDIVLDLNDLFDQERNDCKSYKFYGKLKVIFKNLYSGSTDYNPLLQNLYLTGDGSNDVFTGYIPYNEFAFLRNDVLREQNLTLSGNNPGGFTQDLVFTGQTGHTTITPMTAPYQNWNIFLSYVYSQDPNFQMNYTLSGGTNYSFLAQDGIPFEVTSDGTYYNFKSLVPHGMSEGEYIIISGGTLNNSVPITGRTFLINSVGDATYNSENYVVNVLINQFPSGTTLSSVILGKRCINKDKIDTTTSTYYVHKHKTLTDINDIIVDKIGFESTLFKDEKKLLFQNAFGVYDYLVERNRMESVLFDFKEPFVLTGLTTNLNITPTDLYISVIFRNGNGYFEYPPKVGYSFNFHDTWIDQQFNGDSAKETSLNYVTFTSNTSNETAYVFQSGVTAPIGTVLTGAFVEYNISEMNERIISESFHKIVNPVFIFDYQQNNPTVYSGASDTNLFGLYYQNHYRMMVRQLSPYIESAKTNDIYNLPEYTIYDPSENLWKWRNVYDHGYIDVDGYGTNYPFTNNCHYIKNDINFYIRNEYVFTNKQNGIANFNKPDC
jgi:hypothetical protein